MLEEPRDPIGALSRVGWWKGTLANQLESQIESLLWESRLLGEPVDKLLGEQLELQVEKPIIDPF